MTNTSLPIRPWLPVGPQIISSVLCQLGAIAFPILRAEHALELSKEVDALPFKQQPEEYGVRKVRQDVASVLVPPDSELNRVSDHLEQELGRYFSPSAFESPLELNFRNIQRYAHGAVGIETHCDESINRNIIVVLALRGTGTFTVYERIGGPILVQWLLTPGTLLLLRAPGFYGATKTDRPPHSVTNITGDPNRDALVLRQQVPSIEWTGGC